MEASDSEEETANKKELDSFFVEQLFRDVVDALEDKGYSRRAAEDLLYTGGYQIYCTLDPRIQEIVETVYADQNNFNYKSEKGEMLQSGMTIVDNHTNCIVAIAGRVGEREGAFEWSYAASSSPCGSAIKPLSVYAPAIDAGLLTAASVIDDYPVYRLNDSAWPVNAYSGYRGLLTIQDALRISSNTTAVRTLERLTPAASYTFMTEKLGFTTLVSDDMASAGALALGGLTYGVSTIEMAGAYSTFACNGVYTRPRTFTEVRDRYGNVVISDKRDSWVAMKESTVYTINELLTNVVKSGGTGADAAFDGMTMAGKTGTTNSRRDRYFVGYTPYYTAACWCGFPHPSRINTNDNPAVLAWHKVMKQVHEGLEDKSFPTTSDGMVRVTVCNKTGLLASGCGSTRTVYVPEGMVPAYSCDAHVAVEFCKESGLPAGEFCPEEMHETHYLLDLTRPNTAAGFGYVRQPIMRGLSQEMYDNFAAQMEAGLRDSIPSGIPIQASDSGSYISDLEYLGTCMVHLTPVEPVDPENPDNPNPDDPENPVNWFENPLGPLTPIDPNNPGGTPTDPTTPTNPTNPANPTDPATQPPGGGTTDPGNTGQGEGDNSNAEYLDEFLNLINP